MTRDKKNFSIPRGANEDIDRLRSSIMDRINNETNMPNSQDSVSQPKQDFSTQIPQSMPVQPKHCNSNYYVNETNNNNRPYKSTDESQSFSQDTTFANNQDDFNTPDKDNQKFVKARHSNEPVVYKPKKKKSIFKSILTFLLLLVIVFGLSWALREFVFQAYEIPSGSMERTIMTGDMVFAEKISPKITSPKNGDIITFVDPLDSSRILIKRVIATEGQTVDIKNNKLYVDDDDVNEPYTNGLPTSVLKSSKNISYPYTVPSGSVWVMGDNRTNSQDSRYFGSIPCDTIIGHALCVYWPFSDMKGLC